MAETNDEGVREFYVETDFQKSARRPGGLSRDQALKRAEESIEAFKPTFATWLDEQMSALFAAIPDRNSPDFVKLAWLDAADQHSQCLADVSATMGYRMVSLIASNLCAIFDAIKRGAQNYDEIVYCHIDALQLATQPEYRKKGPEDLAELSEGLRSVLESPRLQPQIDDR
jgi:hypothetical protein